MPRSQRKKGSVLTEKQDAYVEKRLQGGAKVSTVEKSADVAAALAAAREALSKSTRTTREDVLDMFKRAYDLAELAGEASAMVAAAREVGKMLGFYEPERIKVELSMSQARLQEKFAIMSDEQLLEIADGRARVIDGEFTRVS